jgi:hypothetical protein
MLYDSTIVLLQSIVQSLETDKAGWDSQMESGKQCLYEMHQMSKPQYKGYRTEGPKGKTAMLVSVSENVNRAIPYVKAMASAIRRRDRAVALESGKAAIAEMNGSGRLRMQGCSTGRRPESKEISNVVRQHEKSTGKHRAVVEKRRSAGRVRVASSN